MFTKGKLNIQQCLLLILLTSFCLSSSSLFASEANVDSWESMNRKTHKFNDRIDRWVLKPIAKTYDRVLPDPAKRGVRNLFRNIGTPAVALNQLLQGKPKEGVGDLSRFLLNSTIGIGGIFDVATSLGLERHTEDFGQTFSVWGIGNGPYLVIPFRGPSSTTHAAGMVLDAFTNPIRLITPTAARYSTLSLYYVDLRAELLTAEAFISGDEYLFLRDAYLQRREFLVHDGEIEDDPFLDDFDE
ncbi:MAG: VacJ family lipoprotein [Gammaproteobacteria bacterium]|nr:VacJ family lipoprotein [Gammaproteobacteria bacterium]